LLNPSVLRAFSLGGFWVRNYNLLSLHGTWSLALREEHRLRVFENRVLRRIFGPKRDKVTGE
jgi:hypothetical protein